MNSTILTSKLIVQKKTNGMAESNNAYIFCLSRRTQITHLFSVLAIVLMLAFTAKGWGQTAGPNYPATGVDLAGVGTVAWTTPGDIISDNNVFASAVCGASATSHYIRASNFGFSIPVGSIILGITVDIGRYSSGNNNRIRDNIIRLVNGSGTIVGSDYPDVGVNWPNGGVDVNATYGGVADTWAAGLTGIDINDPDFGVVLSVVNANNGNARTAFVDYIRITITYTVPCSGTPAPGNTISSANPVCASANFNLSLQNATPGGGVTYQWQSSSDGITWGNIPGATASTYTATQIVNNYYHCLVTCSGNTGTSSNLLVNNILCYCTPVATVNLRFINGFSTTGGVSNITNTPTAGWITSIGYSNYTAQSCSQYEGYSINYTISNNGTMGMGIWVDWNNDGTFAATERMYNSGAQVANATGSFTVPIGTPAGSYRMRAMADDNTNNPDPCTITNNAGRYGEAEDYMFNVVACLGTPPVTQASNVVIGNTCIPINVSWARGTGYRCAVFMAHTTSGNAAPVDGTIYPASAVFGSGGEIGASGWFCIYDGVGTAVNVSNLVPGETYRVHVCEYDCAGTNAKYNTSTATNNPINSSAIPFCYTHPNDGIGSSSVGTCMTIITNPVTYTDDGGSANYSANIYDDDNSASGIYRTFCPGTAGHVVTATVNSMAIHSTDELIISECASGYPTGTTLWRGYGNYPPGPPTTTGGIWATTFQSTDESGCLTFRFHTDAANQAAGWNITLSTVASAAWVAPVNSDCNTAIAICGVTDFAGTSNGPGLESSCASGCLSTEFYSAWYVWKVTTAGSLSFYIQPDAAADYDFALFKSSDCTMGAPVRCSYYEGNGNTGLMAAETDKEESTSGGGTTNGYVDTLNVFANDYYYLMVAQYTRVGTGFHIYFNGSCGIACESPLPVELLSFDATCDNNNVELFWSTATETNNDYFTIERSADVSNWEFVKSVPGSGNSNSTQYYSALDKDPLSGTSYYRLRQTDFDGHSESFSPLVVSCNNDGSDPQVSYSPNPFTSEMYVDFQNLNFEKATMTIYDVQGNMVYQKNIRNDDFPDKKLNLNLSDLPSGIYMATFITDEFSDTHRILKK